MRPRLPFPSCHAQPTLASTLTLTLSALLLKRPIRRMVVRIGSEESSSILWVHTGGKDCRCRGHKWSRGQGKNKPTLRIQRDYKSTRLWGNEPKRLPGVVVFLFGSIWKGSFPFHHHELKKKTINSQLSLLQSQC